MEDKSKKRLRISLLVILLTIVAIVAVVSYAYIRKTKTQTGTNQVGTLTCLDVSLTDETSAISLTNAIPVDDDQGLVSTPYKFKVTNNCTTPVLLKINLESLSISNKLDISYLKYSINKENDTPIALELTSAEDVIASISGAISKKMNSTILASNASETYELRLWVKNTTTWEQGGNKVYQGKIHIEYEPAPPMPVKGDLITMNIGENLPNTFRVLKVNGTEAEVLSMTNYGSSKFNSSSKTTTFNGTTGQQYKDSTIDGYLNTTIYGKLNDDAKGAIVQKNIVQNMFSYSDEPNNLETSAPYTYDYQYQFNWDNNDWENTSLVGSETVGERYIYLLDVEDIFEYIGKRYISSNELMEMFYNDTSSHSEYLWLRSAYSTYSSDAWRVFGYNGNLHRYNYIDTNAVRVAFTIDLSKISWTSASQ